MRVAGRRGIVVVLLLLLATAVFGGCMGRRARRNSAGSTPTPTTAARAGTATAAATSGATSQATEPGGGSGGTQDSICPDTRWDSVVEGVPVLNRDNIAGVHIWHTDTGWKMHTASAATHTYSGTISTEAPGRFRNVLTLHQEPGDSAQVSEDGRTITFSFTTSGGEDGVDWTFACAATSTFTIRFDGSMASTDRIYLGGESRHPSSNPFTITRT